MYVLFVEKKEMKIRRNKLSKKTKTKHPRNEMKLNGVDFFKDIRQGSTPLKDGMYLIYYEPRPKEADSNIHQSAGMAVTNFSNGRWGVNDIQVKAYLGPLPVLSLSYLMEFTPGFPVNQIFYISTLKKAAKNLYSSGPYHIHMLAFLSPVLKNHFIFYLNSESETPFPIAKASGNNWKSLSKKVSTMYLKKMKGIKDGTV